MLLLLLLFIKGGVVFFADVDVFAAMVAACDVALVGFAVVGVDDVVAVVLDVAASGVITVVAKSIVTVDKGLELMLLKLQLHLLMSPILMLLQLLLLL